MRLILNSRKFQFSFPSPSNSNFVSLTLNVPFFYRMKWKKTSPRRFIYNPVCFCFCFMFSPFSSDGRRHADWLIVTTGDKPHACELCNKRFALACNLRAHMKTHEGINKLHLKLFQKKTNNSGRNIICKLIPSPSLTDVKQKQISPKGFHFIKFDDLNELRLALNIANMFVYFAACCV